VKYARPIERVLWLFKSSSRLWHSSRFGYHCCLNSDNTRQYFVVLIVCLVLCRSCINLLELALVLKSGTATAIALFEELRVIDSARVSPL